MRHILHASPAFTRWLCGNDCRRNALSVHRVDGDYAVFKHAGHSSYIDRHSGIGYCDTFYHMVNVLDSATVPVYHTDRQHRPIMEWAGRWTKKCDEEFRAKVQALIAGE